MARISVADAKQFFISRGYSNVAASAIVGGLATESGSGGYLNTGAVNPGDGRDGSNSVGVAQWNSTRAVNMRNWTAQNSHLGDFAQLGYVDYELRNEPAHSGNALTYLNAASTPQEATSAFLRYERPAGYSAADPTRAHTYGHRLAATNAQLGTAGGTAPVQGGEPIMLDEQGRGVDADGNVVTGGRWSGGDDPNTGPLELGTLHGGGVNADPGTSGGSSNWGTFTQELARAVGINLSSAVTASATTAAQTAVANTTAEIAANGAIATSAFDSIKDYFGRAIFVVVGIVILAFALYLFVRRSN